MKTESSASFKLSSLIPIFLILVGLYLTSFYSYLLFHSLSEIFSIVIAFGIFIIVWNSQRFIDNNYLLFLGVAYLFIGGVDLIHTLSYKGMNVFPGYGVNLPTQLWIAARYMESLSLFIAPFLFNRKIKISRIFTLYSIVTLLLFIFIFSKKFFPDCFIEGQGLTKFKIISEYIISIIIAGSIFALFTKKNEFDPEIFKLLVASAIITIGGEFAFTFYISVYGLSNLIGHFFKIISFFLIYKAIIENGLEKPYNLLFRNLKKSEENFSQINQVLAGVLEHTHILVALLDNQFNFIWVNKGYAAADNQTPSFFQGKNHFELYPHKENEKIFQSVVKTGKPVFFDARAFEYPEQPERGTTYWDWSLVPITSDSEKTNQLVFTLAEVTNRVKAEKAMLREKQASEEYINSLPGLFYVFDEQNFIKWNHEWNKITGYTDEELAVKYGTDFFEGEHKALIKKQMQKVFQEGQAVADAEIVTKDGRSLPYYFTGLLKKIHGKKYLIGLGIDISILKQIEKEREKLIENLQEALGNIKTLKGLLPICAQCKKIRDDKGYWKQIDVYIQQYSEAEFSHGICPECSDKLYGEEKWYMEMKDEENGKEE
ncbi:MAG: PAS domain S-box protein [Desulfobacteraceae bacterium]|nr:PAS domain S-box protein [Desulfobacteraceae bacterium]